MKMFHDVVTVLQSTFALATGLDTGAAMPRRDGRAANDNGQGGKRAA